MYGLKMSDSRFVFQGAIGEPGLLISSGWPFGQSGKLVINM